MDHYSNPTHKGKPTKEGYESIHTDSENCIDDFDVFLLVKDHLVVDALWDGVACTISTASTDILCDLLIGKSYKDAHYIIEQYLDMIEEKPFDESVLNEALVFANTGKQAARIHCATMGWNAADELLHKEEGEKK